MAQGRGKTRDVQITYIVIVFYFVTIWYVGENNLFLYLNKIYLMIKLACQLAAR